MFMHWLKYKKIIDYNLYQNIIKEYLIMDA